MIAELPTIVIAGEKKTIMEYWMMVGHEVRAHKEFLIHFHDKNRRLAEEIIAMMKAFGWIETRNPEKVKTFNNRCTYKGYDGSCANTNINKDGNLKCKEYVRKQCNGYKQKWLNPVLVNEVKVEMPGSLRDD